MIAGGGWWEKGIWDDGRLGIRVRVFWGGRGGGGGGFLVIYEFGHWRIEDKFGE
jgi:hypothetical protein